MDLQGPFRSANNDKRGPRHEFERRYPQEAHRGYRRRGAAGISVAASLHRRDHSLDLAVIEPASVHHYQPGWTLVGGGVFREEITARPMSTVMPDFVQWYRQAVQALDPDQHRVQLSDGRWLAYDILVLAPGLELNWGAIDGLEATLGQNGVTSNYQQGLARYTWDLVQQLRQGRALFSQPPMPIKCAGAPQKAMYLSCDHWRRQGVLGNIDVQFHNAGAVLFGVAAYVPALEAYVRRYGIDLNFQSNLVAVNGPARTATFRHTDAEGNSQDREVTFDLLHAVPPQRLPPSSAHPPWPTATAGWTWKTTPCATAATPMCSGWGMSAVPATPRPPRRSASRRRWWRKT